MKLNSDMRFNHLVPLMCSENSNQKRKNGANSYQYVSVHGRNVTKLFITLDFTCCRCRDSEMGWKVMLWENVPTRLQ